MTRSLIDVLKARACLQDALHTFFRSHQYLSVDAPILVQSPGTEVHLQYFASTWRDYRDHEHALFLRSSPELHLKQALALGLERVYHLGKCFRNGGEISHWHHPEFTMLEYYESGISLAAFMNRTEELIRAAAEALEPFGTPAQRLPQIIERISVYEAFERFAGLSLIDGDSSLAHKAIAKGFASIQATDDFETAYFKIQLDVIEPALARLGAVFLYDYPPSQCALARLEAGRAQRFELYLGGVELCNAFDELLDPVQNRERIEASNRQRRQLGYPTIPEDLDFYEALEQGLKPCCGNALGFDRLLALLLGEPNLDRCVPFRSNRPYRALLKG